MGMLVYIEGKLPTRSWEGKNGEKRQATEVIADTVKMLGGEKPKENQQTAGAPHTPADEDVPF
jgi:single-strand DNA-binding protein